MADRGPAEERMVHFGYYANMAANLVAEHPAISLLKENNYDVEAAMREASEWCYGPGRDLAKVMDRVAARATEED